MSDKTLTKAVSSLQTVAALPRIVWEVIASPDFAKAVNVLVNYFRQKWEASADGFVNQGDDLRSFGRFAAFLQHCLSFNPKNFKTNPYVPLYNDTVIFTSGLPPYLVINIELRPTAEMPERYFHARLGWRYDQHWGNTGGYIISAAAKVVDHKLIYK